MRIILKHVCAFFTIVGCLLLVSFLTEGIGREGARRFINLLFILGTPAVGVGMTLFCWVSKPRRGKLPSLEPKTRPEDRKFWKRCGKIIFLHGLALLALSIVLGTLVW
jgi:hypothetical protein